MLTQGAFVLENVQSRLWRYRPNLGRFELKYLCNVRVNTTFDYISLFTPYTCPVEFTCDSGAYSSGAKLLHVEIKGKNPALIVGLNMISD